MCPEHKSKPASAYRLDMAQRNRIRIMAATRFGFLRRCRGCTCGSPAHTEVSVEQIGFGNAVSWPVDDCSSSLEHHYMVCYAKSLIDELFHQHDGHALRFQLPDRRERLIDDDRRKPGGGLIQHKHPGPRHQGLGNSQHLLLTTRK